MFLLEVQMAMPLRAAAASARAFLLPRGGLRPPCAGLCGGRGGVPSCPALRRGCASWLIDYTMVWNIKLVH